MIQKTQNQNKSKEIKQEMEGGVRMCKSVKIWKTWKVYMVGNSLVQMKSKEEIPGWEGEGELVYNATLFSLNLALYKLRSATQQFTFCDFLTLHREVDVNILVIFFKELIFAINQSSWFFTESVYSR